jgi:hypothetical protein
MNNYCVQQKKDLCSFFQNETHNVQKKIAHFSKFIFATTIFKKKMTY